MVVVTFENDVPLHFGILNIIIFFLNKSMTDKG
jgi:hypothetical protein